MEDKPHIPFVRRLCAHLSEEEIKEAEERVFQFCLWLKDAHENAKLTNKEDVIE